MGRWSTGAITTGESLRIELSYLLKNGFIQKGKQRSGTLSWTNGSIINFESKYTEDVAYLRLIYFNTKHTGEKTEHDYKIYLDVVPSNLGKGEVLYFHCPKTWKPCRILYKSYGSLIWKSREAYQNRIYYNSQISSKSNYYNDRYFSLEKQLENLKKPVKSHYRGKITKSFIRFQRLEGLKKGMIL